MVSQGNLRALTLHIPEACIPFYGVHSSIVMYPYIDHIKTRSTGVSRKVDRHLKKARGDRYIDIVPL